MAHKRSLEKQAEKELRSTQYREAHNFVTGNSYHDPILAESVCLRTPDQINTFLKAKFESVLPCVTQRYERGEVLTDKRGRGSLQTPQKDTEKRDWALNIDVSI